MPKLKNKSAAKKRFRLTARGKVRGNPAYLNHLMRNKSMKKKRQARGTFILDESDARRVTRYFLRQT